MLKNLQAMKGEVGTLTDLAKTIEADAAGAVESLRAFRSWVGKTIDGASERHKALTEALEQAHSHHAGELAEMASRLDTIIAKLEGSTNG